MKNLVFLFIFWAAPSFAATSFKIDDPALLGQYKLAKADKNSNIQTVDVVYNNDNLLVLQMERGSWEYELTEPDAKGVIYSGGDEANCGSGDEEECSFDSSTVITLLSTKDKKGKVIPQLKIDITVSYVWNSECSEDCPDEDFTYILNWYKPLDHSIPFYTNTEEAPELKNILENCEANLKEIKFESATTAYLGAYEVCGGATSSFKYRDTFDIAFPYFKAEWVGGNQPDPVEIKLKDVRKIFSDAKKLAKKYKTPGKVTSRMIVDEIEKMEEYYSNSFDRFFIIPAMDEYDDGAELFFVNTKTQVIVKSEFKIK